MPSAARMRGGGVHTATIIRRGRVDAANRAIPPTGGGGCPVRAACGCATAAFWACCINRRHFLAPIPAIVGSRPRATPHEGNDRDTDDADLSERRRCAPRASGRGDLCGGRGNVAGDCGGPGGERGEDRLYARRCGGCALPRRRAGRPAGCGRRRHQVVRDLRGQRQVGIAARARHHDRVRFDDRHAARHRRCDRAHRLAHRRARTRGDQTMRARNARQGGRDRPRRDRQGAGALSAVGARRAAYRGVRPRPCENATRRREPRGGAVDLGRRRHECRAGGARRRPRHHGDRPRPRCPVRARRLDQAGRDGVRARLLSGARRDGDRAGAAHLRRPSRRLCAARQHRAADQGGPSRDRTGSTARWPSSSPAGWSGARRPTTSSSSR